MGNSKSTLSGYEEGSLEINLSNFKLLRVVGKGSYGKVRVVELKHSKTESREQFALKYIRKIDCVRADFAHNIIRERRILQEVTHPLIVNLRYAFQDEEFMYMVSDLMLGGDLRFHINRKTFSEEAVRFWIAEVACALRYLHARGIIHRDVKPDNILLDLEGHAHLADFNVATYVQPHKKLTGRSGTAAYMAPEVYSGIGYQTSPDWFSLGVTFYECIYPRLPFESDKGDSLSRQIQYTDPPFPHTSPPVSTICVLAMSNLLDRDHNTRIGAQSWESFAEHPFFAALDFRALENKRLPPVFQPPQEKSNFDAVYELEELLLEQAPLEGRARKAAKKPYQQQVHTDGEGRGRKELPPRRKGRTEEEREEEIMEMINEYFEPYDYTRHEDNPAALATLTNEIRRLSLSDAAGINSATHSIIDSPHSRQSTSHDSTKSFNSMPLPPTSYPSSPPHHPSSPSSHGSQSSSSHPMTIRLPPAVARVASKEKKSSVGYVGNGGPSNPIPTSQPNIQGSSSSKGILMGWSRGKEAKGEKWESGVIGRERARVVIDTGSNKRCYHV